MLFLEINLTDSATAITTKYQNVRFFNYFLEIYVNLELMLFRCNLEFDKNHTYLRQNVLMHIFNATIQIT